MGYAFPINTSKYMLGESFWEGAFTEEELDKIEKLGDSLEKVDAGVGVGENSIVNPKVRTTDVSWIPSTDDNTWIFDKLGNVVKALNHDYYGFDLWGFEESLQYSVYHETHDIGVGGHYDWHIDTVPASNLQPIFNGVRKLSISLQLSDFGDYEGGELWIHGQNKSCLTKKRGILHCFPSFMLHRVTPVTVGIRKSLVAWIHGPSYR